MEHSHLHQPDYGTGQKKLSIYLIGLIICTVLTIIAFGVVMVDRFSKFEMLTIIYAAAIIQFFAQVICFLRLNVQTEQSRINVMSILFTIVILVTVIIGSLWIMKNVNYYMLN